MNTRVVRGRAKKWFWGRRSVPFRSVPKYFVRDFFRDKTPRKKSLSSYFSTPLHSTSLAPKTIFFACHAPTREFNESLTPLRHSDRSQLGRNFFEVHLASPHPKPTTAGGFVRVREGHGKGQQQQQQQQRTPAARHAARHRITTETRRRRPSRRPASYHDRDPTPPPVTPPPPR
jgi:hypothetical protein